MKNYHGKTYTPEYKVWNNMCSRCNCTNGPRYKDWGGRGVTVCDKWKKFEGFYEDMGDKPSAQHSLERKDNNKGYDKDNCYWATSKEQSLNRRSNRRLSHSGLELTIKEWADRTGLKPVTISSRLLRGYSTEQALERRLHAGTK